MQANEWYRINKDPSYNSFGQVGLIQVPTADSRDEGTIGFTINQNNIWKLGTLSVSPFKWLEASYFYYRPSDLEWGGVPGLFLDKGFNVKFIYDTENINIPNFAIGLDDFAGTGFFTREYMVATHELSNFKISLGMGWGKFTGTNSFKNPLNIISGSFNSRPITSSNYGKGGTPSFNKWFRGSANYFGGFEYFPKKNSDISIKVEYDPFDYMDISVQSGIAGALNSIRKKDSDINFGLNVPIKDYITLSASYIKGNAFNFSFNVAATFNGKLRSKPGFKPKIVTTKNEKKSELIFYEDLLRNLNNNNLLLQTASLSEKNLDVSISTSQYRNAIRSGLYAASLVQKVSNVHDFDLSKINISHINAGIEMNNITFFANHIDETRNTPIEIIERYTKLDSGNINSYKNHKFQPNVKFPAFFSTTSPVLVSHIGSPEKFYYGGIEITNTSEVQFKRNFLLSSQINYSLYNNFEDTLYKPDSILEHVRTDKVLYLKESKFYLKRLQLDYIWSPKKNLYAKLSSGIFEDMFGGVGTQILYKPFNNNFNISLEGFYVRQRGYSRDLNFKKYKTFTGHVNFGYLFPLGIESNISFGRYLAKDDGYTLDLSRRTRSGFRAGVYFTRTNISAEQFGEGSFDKGFYFQIPMELFSKNYSGNYTNFKLSPLTRDGGAKLEFDKDLRGLIYNSTFHEIKSGWRL